MSNTLTGECMRRPKFLNTILGVVIGATSA
jgi:hypothetical protein